MSKKQLQELAKDHVQVYIDWLDSVNEVISKHPEYREILDSEYVAKAFDDGAQVIIETKPKTSSKKVKVLILVATTGFALHATGADKVLAEKARQRYHRAKLWWNAPPADWNGKHETS